MRAISSYRGSRPYQRDLLGILIAIIGAVTVVTATNASDVRLDPAGFLQAISQPPFIVYSCVYVVGAMILALLSRGRIGRQWVFIDVGLCALFGQKFSFPTFTPYTDL